MPTFVVLEHFIKLGIAQPIVDALSAQGYTTPTPIQAQAIPPALAKQDILGTAQTGTGKTAAFSIPIIQHFMSLGRDKRSIKALILTPIKSMIMVWNFQTTKRLVINWARWFRFI
jgi:ATP-dependent RNA helicase RhlE